MKTKQQRKLDKLVAINSYTATCNLITTTTNQIHKYTLQREKERLEKRYPSLRSNLYV